MAEHGLASTMIAPKSCEIRAYPRPDIPPDAGLLRERLGMRVITQEEICL